MLFWNESLLIHRSCIDYIFFFKAFHIFMHLERFLSLGYFPTFHVQTCETSLLIYYPDSFKHGTYTLVEIPENRNFDILSFGSTSPYKPILFSVIQFKWFYVMIIRILINSAPCSNSTSSFHSTTVIVVSIWCLSGQTL